MEACVTGLIRPCKSDLCVSAPVVDLFLKAQNSYGKFKVPSDMNICL